MSFVFLKGGGTDAANFPAGQNRFQDIGGIHGTAAGGAGTDDGVNFINKQYCLGPFFQLGNDPLQTLFEITAKLGAGQHSAEIKCKDFNVFQQVGNVSTLYPLGQSFGHGRFTDSRITDINRIVFATAAQDLHGSLHFGLAADKRIQLTLGGKFNQIHRKEFQRIRFFLAPFF